MNVCNALGNTPAAALEDSLKQYLDIDRTLWFLAHEILFTDDDSYVWKGGMDYFLYWEPETGRMTPLEYDGNTCMDLAFANTWSPFYRQNDTKYALMNKMFPVPALRQRYLAHVRTIIEESFNLTYVDSLIDAYADFIDAEVSADPKKIYSYNQFLTQVEELKEFMQVRRTYLLNNAEVNTPAPSVGEVAYATNGSAFTAPLSNQPVTVTAEASAAAGIFAVRLYYATGLVGNFQRTEMFDDGNHGDGLAGDGIYGATIPGYPGGTYVRYYIEAVSANTARTVTYSPKGAEHDVFVYRVQADLTGSSEVVINEFMASNAVTASDQDGEFDDWIELYNNGTEAVDLGGWFISDNPNNIPKWEVPAGTIIPGKGYLIVWADENGTQEGLHANFKLSAGGENLYLVLPDTTIVQDIEFPEQETDMGYARIPNGTGDFVIQAPTFNSNNEGVVGTDNPEFTPIVLTIFPNPTDGFVTVETNLTEVMDMEVIHTTGQRLLRQTIQGNCEFRFAGVSNWRVLCPGWECGGEGGGGVGHPYFPTAACCCSSPLGGRTPAFRILITFCSKSNQNGAPNDMAKAVINHPNNLIRKNKAADRPFASALAICSVKVGFQPNPNGAGIFRISLTKMESTRSSVP